MQGRVGAQQALERIRQAAADKRLRFTALLHHVYNLDALRKAYFALNRDASPGVDADGDGVEEEAPDTPGSEIEGVAKGMPDRSI